MLNVIVPYRDRDRQKKILVDELYNFLETNIEEPFRIFLVEQNDDKKFNKGSLINAGFTEVNKISAEGDYYCLHDVDLIPNSDKANYNRPPEHSIIHPYGHEHCLSNIIVINQDTFLKMNGFSNKYWGWGYEDTDFYFRARYHGVKVIRSDFTKRFESKVYKELDKQTHKDLIEKNNKPAAQINRILFENTVIKPEITKDEGLSTIKYTLVKKEEREKHTHIAVKIDNINHNDQYEKELIDYQKLFNPGKLNLISLIQVIGYLIYHNFPVPTWKKKKKEED